MKNNDEKLKGIRVIYIFIFILLIMGIAAGGYISYRNFEREFRHQAEHQLSAIAELKVDGLVNWRKERLDDAEFLYHNPAFSALVERYFENSDDVEARAQLFTWLDDYQVYDQYGSVRLLDSTGTERLSISTPDLSDPHLTQDAVACLHSGKIAFSDFHRDTSTGDVHLAVLVPIFADGDNNRPLGVLALGINPQRYLYPYIQSWPIPSDTAETLLVRREGENVLYLNELRDKQDAALNLHLSLTDTDIPAVKAVLGQEGIVEGLDYRGEPVLADVRPVPDSPWFLVSKMDIAEVYLPLRARLWQTLLIIGLAIFAAGAGLAFDWRQQRILFYRTQAEAVEALKLRESYLTAIIENQPGLIWLKDLDGQFLAVNGSFALSCGKQTSEELLGKTDLDIYPRELAEKYRADDTEVIRKKIPLHVEELISDLGKIKWFETFKMPIFNETSQVIGTTGFACDITERKQAENALRESEDKFKYVFDYSVVGKSITNLDGEIHVNSAFCDMLGYSPQELQEKRWQEITHPNDIELTQNNIDEISSGKKESVRFVKRFVHKNGSIIWVDLSSTVRRDQQNKPLYLMSTLIDITDRKRTEEAVKESEANLRSLIDNRNESIWSLDVNYNFMTFNSFFGEAYFAAYKIKLEKGMNAITILEPELQAFWKPKYDNAMSGQKMTFEFYAPVGNNLNYFEVNLNPIVSDGIVTGLSAISVDITERKQVEEALRESEERLRLAVLAGRMGTWDRNFLSGQLNWSVECKAMFGLPPEIEMNDERFMNALHPQDRAATDLAVNTALEKQTDFNTEYRVIWPDGTIHWIAAQGRGYYNKDGQAIHMAGITFDITERKQAEVSLRQYTTTLEEAEKSANLGSWGFDMTTGRGWWSEQMYRMFGFEYSNEIPNVEEYLNRIHPEDRQLVQDVLFKMTQGEELPIREYRSNPAYGPMRYFLPMQIIKRDADGKPLQMIGTLLDITERKQAEKTLRENEEMFRVAFDNAPTGMSIIGAVGFNFLAVNPLLCEMFGYTKEELLGNTIKLVTHPDDVERSNEWIRKKYSNEPCESDFEKRYIHKDGHIVWALVRAQWIRNEDGSPRMAINHILDITKRKQAEEALRESEALYRQAIEVANAVPYRQSYHVDGETVRYDFIGEGIRQITGYGPEEFTEALWDSLTQERFLLDDLAKYPFDDAIERVRSGVDPVWKCEHRIRARDGSIHWVFEAAVELRNENGISHGSIGLFQDITERKLAEEEIYKLNAELEQRVRERTIQLETTNKELEAFSYSVSHDLRAPLRGIDGWSQALLEDYSDKLDEQARKYIDRVRSETQRMGYLIDDMLKLSRLTRAEMAKEQVDLSALAQAVAGRLQQTEPQRQVGFNIQAGLIAEGDSRLLEAVLANLLGNAFKFTAKRADARIEFGKTESQGQRVFFVRDNGAGFDMAYSQKLFGAFQRMHKVTEFPGNGIGLATAQRIIHRHGGRIWAEAEIGRGAVFYFTLG